MMTTTRTKEPALIVLIALLPLAGCVIGEISPQPESSATRERLSTDASVGQSDGSVCSYEQVNAEEAADRTPAQCLPGKPLGTCSCSASSAPPIGPNAGSTFDCPVYKMDYCGYWQTRCFGCRPDEDENPRHMDCDDFAMACAAWGQRKGINVCQVSYSGLRDPAQQKKKPRTCETCKGQWVSSGVGTTAHVINVVEYADKKCLVEPQWSPAKNAICCWAKQGPNDHDLTVIPASCRDKACEHINARPGGSCRIRRVWCDTSHSPSAGELPFYVHKEVCKAFDATCGFSFPKSAGGKDAGVDADADAGSDRCPNAPTSGPYPEPSCPCNFSSACRCGAACVNKSTGKGLERKSYCESHCSKHPNSGS